MLNNRLLAIANLVDKNSIVLDVGTDHAYLPIYLSKNKICKKAIASDISQGALEGAAKNVKKYKAKVKLVLSDGLENIEDKYDTLIISGMGTKNIMGILQNKKLPEKIILSSNNNLPELRKFMNDLNYWIVKEVVICENNKYYDIISYHYGKEYLSKIELKYGKSKDKKYYKYLYSKNKMILKKVKGLKRIQVLYEMLLLKLLTI